MHFKTEFSKFADDIRIQKYARDVHGRKETWEETAYRVAFNVLDSVDASNELIHETAKLINERKFIPGGRQLYAAGRPFHQINNCFLLKAEDSREGWSQLMYKSAMCLMTGGGIGVDYSDVRPEGSIISRTGGFATGPISLMQILNEQGRGIMQGGSRRCLPDNSLVTMADLSKKRIDKIQIGDLVHTRFGPKKVTNIFDQGYQEIVEIKTKLGRVFSTENHKWLTVNGARSKSFYIPVNKLSLSCKLYALPTAVPGGLEYDTSKAYTIGYYLGDGCAYHSNRTHEVTFQLAGRKYVKPQADRIMSVMSSLGSNPTTRDGHGDCTEIRCRGKQLVDIFQKYKTPNKPFLIPEEIKKANLEARYAFIAGWFDADGYFGKDSLKIANTHPSTRQDLSSFLNDLGFITSESGIEVRISSYQVKYFNDTVGKYTFKKSKFFSKRTKEKPEVPSDILSIKKIGFSHTFDIEVEDVHEFVADGFISHNSAIWAGLRWDHADVHKFIQIKNWSKLVRSQKAVDYNFPATLDGTNISVQLNDEFFAAYHNTEDPKHSLAHSVYWAVIERMLKTGEPGFSVDCGENAGETLRNAPVSAGTRVLTNDGYLTVGEIVDTPRVIWTGKNWAANVIFKLTNANSKLVEVSLSNGRKIVCDPSHPFMVKTYIGAGERKSVLVSRVNAKNLNTDDKLSSELPETNAMPRGGKLLYDVQKDWKPYRDSEIRVVDVKFLDRTEPVYCCNVGLEEHSFMAEGVVISNCTELTSADDSDVCCIGSINMARIGSLEEMEHVTRMGTLFLLAATVYSDTPYDKVKIVRDKNRRLGLGLLGLHEWLLRRGKKYGPDAELEQYLEIYKQTSRNTADFNADLLGFSRPVKVRAIAPTGTISILAETTGGIEPLFCSAYRRRYLKGSSWHYQFVIDPICKSLVDAGIRPDDIEDAYSIDPKRRVEFQVWVQKYVDHAISSTINLPSWGSESNNEDTVRDFGNMLISHLPNLRGITAYPDGARSGQPLQTVPYKTAIKNIGQVFQEQGDICDIRGGGTCGA